jgi:hypothetical protein
LIEKEVFAFLMGLVFLNLH